MSDALTREQACFKLAAARYGTEAPALLDEAERWPGTWQYTADRHRAVVKLPGGRWDVVDCAESEDRIAAIRAAGTKGRIR